MREIQPQGFVAAGLQIEPIRITTGAAPVCGVPAEQDCRIEIGRVPMIGVDVVYGLLLDLHQRVGTGNIGQKLFGLEINDATESGYQMDSVRSDLEKGKILKTYKVFRGRMSVEVTLAQNLPIGEVGLLRATHQHDARSFEWIALGPLIEHQ